METEERRAKRAAARRAKRASMTPEEREAERAYKLAWARANPEKVRGYAAKHYATPEGRAKSLQRSADFAKKNPDYRKNRRHLVPKDTRVRVRDRRVYMAEYYKRRFGSAPGPYQFVGVLGAAVPSPARDLLLRLGDLVPRVPYRDDVIADAALRVLEGAEIEAAARAALAAVRRSVCAHWHHRPAHEAWDL